MKAHRESGNTALFFLQPRCYMEVGGNAMPRRFTPGKETWYPLHRRLSGPPGRSGRVRKISLPPRFDHRTVQPAQSPYTD